MSILFLRQKTENPSSFNSLAKKPKVVRMEGDGLVLLEEPAGDIKKEEPDMDLGWEGAAGFTSCENTSSMSDNSEHGSFTGQQSLKDLQNQQSFKDLHNHRSFKDFHNQQNFLDLHTQQSLTSLHNQQDFPIYKDKRERSHNFSKWERSLLVRLANKHAIILENKKTDSMTNFSKSTCWERITREFNAASNGPERAPKVLKVKYDAVKKELRRSNICCFREPGESPLEPPYPPEAEEERLLLKNMILSSRGLVPVETKDDPEPVNNISPLRTEDVKRHEVEREMVVHDWPNMVPITVMMSKPKDSPSPKSDPPTEPPVPHEVPRASRDLPCPPHDVPQAPHDLPCPPHDVPQAPHDLPRPPHDVPRPPQYLPPDISMLTEPVVVIDMTDEEPSPTLRNHHVASSYRDGRLRHEPKRHHSASASTKFVSLASKQMRLARKKEQLLNLQIEVFKKQSLYYDLKIANLKRGLGSDSH